HYLVSRVCHARVLCFFFFQAEDGIRDPLVTGVQTCALPISDRPTVRRPARYRRGTPSTWPSRRAPCRGRGAPVWRAAASGGRSEIGRASCRERGEMRGVDGDRKKKKGSIGS